MMPSESNRDIDISVLVVIGIVSTLLIYEIVVGTIAWYYYALEQEHQAKNVQLMDPVIAEEIQSQKSQLTDGYAWVNQDQGTVKIPIDRAIDQWVQENGQTGAAPQDAPAAH